MGKPVPKEVIQKWIARKTGIPMLPSDKTQESLGVPQGDKIPAKKGGKLSERARFSQIISKMKKSRGQ